MLVGQSKNQDTPFHIADWSVKESFSGDWKQKVRGRIRCTQVVAVICGHYTNTASGVDIEIKIARELGIPYFLLAGRSSGINRRPIASYNSDKIYNWTWGNLKLLFSGRR